MEILKMFLVLFCVSLALATALPTISEEGKASSDLAADEAAVPAIIIDSEIPNPDVLVTEEKESADPPLAAEAPAPAPPITESTKDAAPFSTSYVSKIIATNMLKSFIDIDGNQVHSPLGVASILAVLAEGAAGDTYEEFRQVFGYPNERANLRASFKQLLSRYQQREFSSDPSFQTWLYIYRNYTAFDAFKEAVRGNYFVEVKDINRNEYDWSEPNTSLDQVAETSTISNSKDVVGFETLKRIKLADNDLDLVAAASVQQSAAAPNTYGEEVVDKEASKFDRVVDDKQYVEKPVILEEIKREQEQKQQTEEKQEELLVIEESKKEEELVKPADEEEKLPSPAELPKEEQIKQQTPEREQKREDDFNVEENETVQTEEKIRKNYGEKEESANVIVPIQDVLDSNEPEKVTLPLEKLEIAIDEASKDAGEIMIALESHIGSVRRIIGARSLFRKDDIATALSANSITGRSAGAKTKMLLFNGLYYRGNWAKPFTTKDNLFYMSADEYQQVPTMFVKGYFKVANLEKLNAKAVYLPYENPKYAMLIIVPNEIEGLHALIDKVDTSDFQFIRENAREQNLCVCLPKFQVEETSRSEAMLKNLGLKKIFSREEADLSLLSEDKDLHVDEVVQFVNVRVDEFGSTENSLAAVSLVRNSDDEHERLSINRPFLYFLTDLEEDFIIASGKIYTPELKEDLPITVEVEFEQA